MMKSISSAMLLSLLMLSAQSTFAAPQDYQRNTEIRTDKQYIRIEHRHYERGNRENTRDKDQAERGRGAERSMQVGAPIPIMYREAEQVDPINYPKLTPPSRYQQWVKVGNRFLLINVLTNTVIKVVPE